MHRFLSLSCSWEYTHFVLFLWWISDYRVNACVQLRSGSVVRSVVFNEPLQWSVLLTYLRRILFALETCFVSYEATKAKLHSTLVARNYFHFGTARVWKKTMTFENDTRITCGTCAVFLCVGMIMKTTSVSVYFRNSFLARNILNHCQQMNFSAQWTLCSENNISRNKVQFSPHEFSSAQLSSA